ncbi:restriction endonuclease subunit S, partial [Alistipes sp.]
SILQWAIQGKLVPQDPNDEPASVLLERIRAEKARLVKEKKIKKDKNESIIYRGDDNSYYEKMLATGEVKCIDEEIPFEIPQGWEWERFGNVMINKDSERVPLSVAQRQHLKKTYDYYGASGVIDKVDKYLFDKDLLLIGEDGANLINRSTPIAFIAKGKYWVNNHAHVLDVCSEMALSYVALFINAISLVDYVTGTAQPKMNQEKMNSILLAIPPVKEQHRILEKMSMVDAFIDKYATLQTKLDSLDNSVYELLRKSILQEAIQGKLVPQIAEEGSAQELLEQIKAEKQKLVKEGKLKKSALATSVIFRGDDNKYYEQVGKKCLDITEQIPFETPKNWVWTRLSHIANIYTGNSISETEKKSKFTDVIGRYYIGTKDVDFNNRIIYDNGIAIPKQYEPDFRLAPNNSILMCIEGGSAGRKIAILNQDVCFGNKLCCFSPFVGIGKYMYYYLQSPSFFELFNLNKTGIIGGVSIAKVKEILIPLPPIKEQQRIVAQIEKLFEQLR